MPHTKIQVSAMQITERGEQVLDVYSVHPKSENAQGQEEKVGTL